MPSLLPLTASPGPAVHSQLPKKQTPIPAGGPGATGITSLRLSFLHDALWKTNPVVSPANVRPRRDAGLWPPTQPPVFAVSDPVLLCFLLQAPCWAQTAPPWGWPGHSVSCSCCRCVAATTFQVSLCDTFRAGGRRRHWLPHVRPSRALPPSCLSPEPQLSIKMQPCSDRGVQSALAVAARSCGPAARAQPPPPAPA